MGSASTVGDQLIRGSDGNIDLELGEDTNYVKDQADNEQMAVISLL